jgi:hypothetical protein
MPAEPDEADTDFGLGPFQRRHIAVGCCTWALSGMHIGLFVVSGEHEPCEQKPRGVHPFFGYRTVTEEFRLVCEEEYKIPNSQCWALDTWGASLSARLLRASCQTGSAGGGRK